MRRIRIILLLGLLVSLCPSLRAANPVKLKGKVLDAKSGEPVVGAVVKLDENYLWAVTDLDGKFSVEGIQPGSYPLNVSCLGYVDDDRKIDLTKDILDLEVKLSVSSLALDEVVVTAEKSKENINTTQKIGRNALDHLQMSSMTNITALLPGGKTINPDLTTENTLSLRSGGSTAGNAAFGTAIEIDGVRMGDNANLSGMGGVGTRGVSVDNIESVEVTKQHERDRGI